jgi:tetratricopeptide (TPR) repeat protein
LKYASQRGTAFRQKGTNETPDANRWPGTFAGVTMLQIDPLSLIPDSLKTAVRDAVVDFVSDQAKKMLGNEVSSKIKKLRSDAAFNTKFEQGLKKALKRFVDEYAEQDEDLVAAIEADTTVFQNAQVQKALLEMLKNPGRYLADEHEAVAENFATVFPGRKNRERVDKAIAFLLRCLAEELWNLPELQPIYSLQFQRMTAESTHQQVALQKAQLQEMKTMNEGVRHALLQLTDAIAEKKLLPGPDSSSAPAMPRVLHNLPQPDYGQFVGREEELQKIHQILKPYPASQFPVVSIDGIGGIGKSTIALEVAHHYLRNYEQLPIQERFDAIIWISAKQTLLTAQGIQKRPQVFRSLEHIYSAIAITLENSEITKADSHEQAEMVRKALTNQRTLLFIDNLETVDDEKVSTFLMELPAPTKAVITSRYRIDIVYPIRLQLLPKSDGRKLIQLECHKRSLVLSEEEMNQLQACTNGLPLAIVWSIAQIAQGYETKTVINRLTQHDGNLLEFCFKGSFDLIHNLPAEKLLTILGVMPKDASRHTLGNLAELNEQERDDGLVLLEKLSLMERRGDRFSILPLTKGFVLGKLEPESANELQAKALNLFADLFQDAGKNESTNEYEHSKYESIGKEIENVLGLIDWAIDATHYDEAINAIRRISDFMWLVGRWSEMISYLEKGIEIAEHRAKSLQVALFKRDLGRLLRFQEKNEQAEYATRSALSIFQHINEPVYLVDAQRNLGMILIAKGNLAEAEIVLADCLSQAETLDHEYSKGFISHILNNYVEVLLRQDKDELAEKHIERAEKIANENNIGRVLVTNYRLRGRLLFKRNQYRDALVYFQRAKELCEELNITQDLAYSLKWIVRTAIKIGDKELGRQNLLRALELHRILDMQIDDYDDLVKDLEFEPEQT